MSKTINNYDKFYTYKITNKITSKIYIGETYNFETRLNKHFASAKCGSQTYLHRSIRKHGENNFIIEKLGEFATEEEALAAEIELITNYNSNNPEIGYNLTSGGDKTTYTQMVIDTLSQKSLELWQDENFILKSFHGKTGLTLEDVKDIFEMKNNGVKTKDIASIYNKDRGCIRRILSKKSWKNIISYPAIIEENYKEEVIYDIRNKINSGMTYEEISSILKISIHTIRKMAKGYGSYAKYKDVPIIKNLKLIDKVIIDAIRDDFIKNQPTFKKLSKKYNICSDVISDIIYGHNHYSYLDPLMTIQSRKKFNNSDIISIRNIYKNTHSISNIAKQYKVDYKTIYNIVNNKSYIFED